MTVIRTIPIAVPSTAAMFRAMLLKDLERRLKVNRAAVRTCPNAIRTARAVGRIEVLAELVEFCGSIKLDGITDASLITSEGIAS